MLTSFFVTVNTWMTGGGTAAAVGSLLWGMISVMLSPCHLASIPLIVAYVAGQEHKPTLGQAALYSTVFTAGLFVTIAIIGVFCSLLGRMLGDIGHIWPVLVGMVLIWVALGMLGVEKCTFSGSALQRLNLTGFLGAFVLGLCYGVLSGSCTFGFIAPILAVISVQKQVTTGLLLIFLFAAGHCLPIAAAGSSAAAVRRVIENRFWQQTGDWFRKGAGAVIGLLGIYFIASPFVTGS